MTTFRRQTLSGLGWSLAGQVTRQVLTLIVSVVLARILAPSEFGLVAMILVLTRFASMFMELGLSAALIQRSEIRAAHLTSVFWLNLALGAALGILFFLAAPLIARFYGEPALVPLASALSATFFLSSLGIVNRAMLTKALRFRALFFVETLSVAAAGGTAIVLAVLGKGVWSLAAQAVVLSFSGSALLWIVAPWRPGASIDRSAVRDLFKFSAGYAGFQVLNYWSRNLDKVLIGRFGSPAALGVYNYAYSVLLFPLNNVSRVVARVLFPALSTIKDETERLREVYLRVVRAVAFLTFPALTGLLAVADRFTFAVLGPQWAEMVPIVRVFCVLGMFQAVTGVNGSLYLSQGRTGLQLKVGLVLRISNIVGIVAGLPFGSLGVAIGYTVSAALNTYPAVHFAAGLVGITYSRWAANLLGVLATSLLMGATVFAAGELLSLPLGSVPALAGLVLAGAILYILVLTVFSVPAWTDFRYILKRMLDRNEDHA